ncbi:MAG: DUF4919 domain-containing protein [Muribaculaceae bacterium]|nr:DUF4919 domain-containing protein [Muribaculaceae bacterium]
MNKFTSSILFILVSLVSFTLTAQKITVAKPDFSKIKEDTFNPESNYYFPKLLTLYQSNDTVMKVEDYRHLYFGYMFQDDYNPYRKSKYSDIIEPLYYKNKHTVAESDTIMKYAELSLADNPFDLLQMNYYIIALKEKRKNARASIWQYRLNHLVEAIISSGNGTEEQPWYVISPAHEYNLLNFMDLVATGHESVDGNIDYIKVNKKNAKTPAGYYFDVSRVLETYNRKFLETK